MDGWVGRERSVCTMVIAFSIMRYWTNEPC